MSKLNACDFTLHVFVLIFKIQKWIFWYHLLTLMSFQTCMTFYMLSFLLISLICSIVLWSKEESHICLNDMMGYGSFWNFFITDFYLYSKSNNNVCNQ